MLATAMHPGVQKWAQAEIEKVIGQYSLPEVADRESLPYVMAIMKEVFRWDPILMLSRSRLLHLSSHNFTRLCLSC